MLTPQFLLPLADDVDHHSLVTSNLLKLRGTSTGSATSEPKQITATRAA